MSVAARTNAAMRRFAARTRADDTCDLCGARLPESHEHVVDTAERRVLCACTACALLLGDPGGRRRRIVPRAHLLRELVFEDVDFEALDVPVRLAFFCPSEVHGKVFALFPNAAGATEGSASLGRWSALAAKHPALGAIAPDVEALLVDARGPTRHAIHVSIDVCHRLVGTLRATTGRHGSPWIDFERALLAVREAAV